VGRRGGGVLRTLPSAARAAAGAGEVTRET
jgi:hypothetical protein